MQVLLDERRKLALLNEKERGRTRSREGLASSPLRKRRVRDREASEWELKEGVDGNEEAQGSPGYKKKGKTKVEG